MAGMTSPRPDESSIDRFLARIEERTTDPVHQRLVKAARRPDPKAAMENELARIIEEILR
jgi:hypothetical protein